MHLGVEHAAGLVAVTHEGECDAVVGIHTGMECIFVDGGVDGLGVGVGHLVELSVGGGGLVGEHFLTRHASELARTACEEQGDEQGESVVFHFHRY